LWGKLKRIRKSDQEQAAKKHEKAILGILWQFVEKFKK
jgi:hypothetical protein